jgi:hypothetical protein
MSASCNLSQLIVFFRNLIEKSQQEKPQNKKNV